MPFGGIETAGHFGPRIRRWAGRLGIRDPSVVTVLADAAEWIWTQAAAQLPDAAALPDIYQADEHLAGCGQKLYGEGTAGGGVGWKRRGGRCRRAAGRHRQSGPRHFGAGLGRRRSTVPWTS